jgi:hypothetical protein
VKTCLSVAALAVYGLVCFCSAIIYEHFFPAQNGLRSGQIARARCTGLGEAEKASMLDSAVLPCTVVLSVAFAAVSSVGSV